MAISCAARLVLKEQSNFGLREVERVYQNIQLMDISSRGYALIRQPEYLFWTVKMARDRNTEIFRHLDSIFVAQNFTNPDRYAEVKKGLTEYTNMYEQMVLHLQANEDSLYIDILKKDMGRYFWDVFNPFSKNVNEFEAKINEESKSILPAGFHQQHRCSALIGYHRNTHHDLCYLPFSTGRTCAKGAPAQRC